MSFDIGVSDNERNELPCYIGNDGCVLENERSTYSYFSPPLNGSPIPDRSVKASFLSTIKEVFTDSFGSDHNEIPVKMNRSMVINGLNVTTVTPAVITKMSVENANSFLNQVFIEGYLFKKGFRRLRLWKKRYFVLRSNVLLYYDKTDHTVPRRRCEITPDCKVMMENIPGRPYAFSMVPCKGQCPYFLDGLSNQERDVWIHYFSLVQLLTKRLCTNLPRSPKQSILDIISLQETLGKGAYGVVRLGRYLDTGEMCAVKVINKQKVGKDILDCELAVIRKVKNEIDAKEIVRIYDVFEDTYLVYIVMEYMGGGDLHSRLIHNPVFSEPQAASIIHCIARGIHILHQKNIYHLDVKPENIIYESNDKHSAMKLTDFGCSLLVEHLNRDTNEIVGTAGYMAPEVISNYNYSEKADVYSLGVILFILLMGYPPFEGNSSEELLHKTVNNRIEYNEEDWEGVSADALLLVKNMLAKNPEERLSIEEVLSFPWVSNPCKSYRKSLRSSHPLLDFSLPTTLPGSKLYSVASIVC